MSVHDVVLEVPKLLGANVAHLLGLVLVHNLDDWYLFSKMFKVWQNINWPVCGIWDQSLRKEPSHSEDRGNFLWKKNIS